jgi:ectoine hydroxylase-related dioxygenase (phytanoyl-CoA dioxygenase family)
MDMGTARRDLQVEPLSAADQAQLDRDGFLPLPGTLSVEQIERFRQRLDELVQLEGEAAGLEVHQEAGTDRLSDLVNKDRMFDICFTHPRVLAAIGHVLNHNFKLSSLNFRAALPGQGLQALHCDWSGAVAAGDYYVCNSIWLLDDFTAENGATRVVPGSQHYGQTPQEALADPRAPHPDEQLLLAPAGTVVIFNSHTWHGGTLNRTASRRRAMHSYFCRRDQPQQLNQKQYARPETLARLSPAARYILDI